MRIKDIARGLAVIVAATAFASSALADDAAKQGGSPMIDEMVKMNQEPVKRQSAVEKEKKKYETLSNASRTRHRTNQNTIENLR